MTDSPKLTIGDLAKATGTKVVTIRYYEQIGLLPVPPRTAGRFRAYRPQDLGRLMFIRRSRDLGFTLQQVRDLLGLAAQEVASARSWTGLPASTWMRWNRRSPISSAWPTNYAG